MSGSDLNTQNIYDFIKKKRKRDVHLLLALTYLFVKSVHKKKLLFPNCTTFIALLFNIQ